MKLKNSWEKKGEYLNSVNSFYHQEKKRKMEKRQKLCYLIHFFNMIQIEL